MTAGEEIAFSGPYVSDAQRAAAGRETVAARMRTLLPGNRQRAAAAYAVGGLPDGAEVLRVWSPRDPAELRGRLGDGHFAVWAEDDVLHVLWRGEAEQVVLGGGVHAAMWPVDGDGGLWEASLRVRRLDDAVIMIAVMALGAADLPFGRPMTDMMIWRGPRRTRSRARARGRKPPPTARRRARTRAAGRRPYRRAARTPTPGAVRAARPSRSRARAPARPAARHRPAPRARAAPARSSCPS